MFSAVAGGDRGLMVSDDLGNARLKWHEGTGEAAIGRPKQIGVFENFCVIGLLGSSRYWACEWFGVVCIRLGVWVFGYFE